MCSMYHVHECRAISKLTDLNHNKMLMVMKLTQSFCKIMYVLFDLSQTQANRKSVCPCSYHRFSAAVDFNKQFCFGGVIVDLGPLIDGSVSALPPSHPAFIHQCFCLISNYCLFCCPETEKYKRHQYEQTQTCVCKRTHTSACPHTHSHTHAHSHTNNNNYLNYTCYELLTLPTQFHIV